MINRMNILAGVNKLTSTNRQNEESTRRICKLIFYKMAVADVPYVWLV